MYVSMYMCMQRTHTQVFREQCIRQILNKQILFFFFPLSVIIPYTFNTRKFILFFFLEVNIPKSILLFSALHRRYTLSQFPLKNLKPTAWLLKEILFCPASVLRTTWKKPPGHSLFWTSLKETDTVWLQLINPQTWGINNIILLSDAINMTFTN